MAGRSFLRGSAARMGSASDPGCAITSAMATEGKRRLRRRRLPRPPGRTRTRASGWRLRFFPPFAAANSGSDRVRAERLSGAEAAFLRGEHFVVIVIE